MKQIMDDRCAREVVDEWVDTLNKRDMTKSQQKKVQMLADKAYFYIDELDMISSQLSEKVYNY